MAKVLLTYNVINMKYLLIFSLVIVFIGKAVAQEQTANLDSKQGILNLPEVIVIPKSLTFSATLRQVEGSEFTLELESLTPISRSFIHYDPDTKILYIPTLTMGNKTYQEVQFELISTQADPMRFRMIALKMDPNSIQKVSATVETKPVSARGDAADDPAIWIHPNNPAESIIIGTQKI